MGGKGRGGLGGRRGLADDTPARRGTGVSPVRLAKGVAAVLRALFFIILASPSFMLFCAIREVRLFHHALAAKYFWTPLNSQGGFTLAYKRLVVLAQSMLDTYAGDYDSRVVLRQWDAEEVVNAAFERIFTEAAEIGPETYNSLRSHIQNHVHSLAKSTKQARTVRVDGSEQATALYQQQTDPTETSAVDRVLIADDFEFCVKVMARLELEGRDDPEVGFICRAVAAGHRDYADLCRHAQLSPPAFDAGMKRLKRKFLHLVRTVETDLTPTSARSGPDLTMKSEPRHEAFAFLSAIAVPTPAMIDAMSEAELDAWLTTQGADVSGLDRRIEARRLAFAARLAARSARSAAVAPPATPPSPAWAEFPFTAMFKRGWFPSFTGTLAAARAEAETLVADFIRQAIPEPVRSLQRQKVRTGGVTNPPALLAWQCRVLLLARAARRCPYAAAALTPAWQADLVRLSRFADGPVRAIEHLARVGLPVIIEPHLPGTHLDGAALLSPEGPVIGLTLRHDRTDNFWFVLLHELMHVRHHLRAGTREDIRSDITAHLYARN
eukprot:gene35793-46448_t